MRAFIKYTLPDLANLMPSSAYCAQKQTDLKMFECLFIWPSGVPNREFNINFNYNYQGKNGYCTAPVDPLKSLIKTRSLN